MYGVISFLAWSMFGLVSLVFLAELADMAATALRRRHAFGAASPGAFSLRPRESALETRHGHTTRTSGGSWSGLNKVE